ncbi:MAG: acylphosphatase [Chloroflexia bacterium]
MATVRGRVQGVGFRVYVRWRAKRLMLGGFVENRADGSVYVVAAGERATLEQLLSDLRRGPSQAHVSVVEVQWLEQSAEGLPSHFEVRH